MDSNFPFRARETDVLRLDPAVALGSLGLANNLYTEIGIVASDCVVVP
jgi:hypothetical protein